MKKYLLIAVPASFVLLAAIVLVTPRRHVDPYYDTEPQGTALELVENYANLHKEMKALEAELNALGEEFAQAKEACGVAFDNYTQAMKAADAALEAASAASATDSRELFRAAREADERREALYKPIEATQAAANSLLHKIRPKVAAYEEKRELLERAESDYCAIACGGSRRFYSLDRAAVCAVEKQFVDQVRAAHSGDESVIAICNEYDAAFERFVKIVSLSSAGESEHNRITHEYYEARSSYEKLSKAALKEATVESENLAWQAYQRLQAAKVAEAKDRETGNQQQKEYSAASDAYKAAFEKVLSSR